MHICVCTCILYIHTYVCIETYTYICMYIHISIYIGFTGIHWFWPWLRASSRHQAEIVFRPHGGPHPEVWLCNSWGFPSSWGAPIAGWFMEDPMKMDDLGPRGTPILRIYEASISVMALVVMNWGSGDSGTFSRSELWIHKHPTLETVPRNRLVKSRAPSWQVLVACRQQDGLAAVEPSLEPNPR